MPGNRPMEQVWRKGLPRTGKTSRRGTEDLRRQEWVTRPIRPWDHKTLDIYWLQKPWLDNGKYAHALIWSVDPVYCAASVYMRDDSLDRKSTRLNSSHGYISYAVFCLKKKMRRHR